MLPVVTLPKKDGVIDRDGSIRSIIINPNRVISVVENHFENYLKHVRNTSEADIRSNFLLACKNKWALDEPPVVIGLDPTI